jgi:muramoyltetrapeptide carboxypeptidase
MQITIPNFLKAGDTILIVNSSGYIPFEKLEQAKSVLNTWGYQVEFGKHVHCEAGYFAGTDEERLADLQWALDHTSAKLIIFGRGGYGLSRIVDAIDWRYFQKNPKWICGFSDITVLHSHIHQICKVATLHGPMCAAYASENLVTASMKALRLLMQGVYSNIEYASTPFNKAGIAQGVLVGGNLCMLAHLTGSVSQLDTQNKLLFIEDIGEHYYKIDRMLYSLKRSGQLKYVKGLICGNFSDMEDTTRPFGKNLYEIILDHFEGMDIPIAFDMPIGHETINYPIVLGQSYIFQVSDEKSILQALNVKS